MAKLTNFIRGTCPYVLLFGAFVGISLVLQCAIPFLLRMAEIYQGWDIILAIFNSNFVLPMETISNFWAAISAAYVGLDRAAFAVDTLNNGSESAAFSDEKMTQLTQILWLSFIIYCLAVGLNTFFDAELALTPLFVSFGSCVLCYVGGNKAVSAFQKKGDADIEDDKTAFMDKLDEQQLETMEKISKLITGPKDNIIVKIEKSKLIGAKTY